MARPLEFNQEIVNKLEEIFALDGTVSEACHFAGITRQTYYNHVNKDAPEGTLEKELFDRFEGLRNRPVLKARRTVVDKLGESYQNAMDYLKRKRKIEFGDNLDVTSDNKPIPLLGGATRQDDDKGEE